MYKKNTALVSAKCSRIPIKFLLMMKLVIIMLFSTFMQVSASSYAQKVSLSVKNVHLKDVFNLLRKQTGYDFLYNTAELNNSSRVTLNVNNEELREVLNRCFRNQPLTYTISNTTVLVRKKTNVLSLMQPLTVTGKVTDTKGEPLAGVSVKVKNSQVSAVTDANGNFKINVPNNDAILVFSYLGFASQEKKVGDTKIINIRLAQEISKLNEVVIVAYGEQQRKDLTGAVSEVDLTELQKAPVSKFEDALAGRIAGVSVNSDDGQPGSEMNIVIRGGNSLTQSNAPLYVIDGFPSEEAVGSMISPNDIESITVLKDASATAIYGSRAANGVVIIETKKAKVGKPVINYNLSSGFQEVTRKIPLMSGYEFVKYQMELDSTYNKEVYLDRPNRTLEDYKTIAGVDWQNMLFGNSRLNIHDFSISGGNENAKYRFSGAVYDQDGVILNTGYNRYHGRAFLEQNLSKKFKVTANLNINRQLSYGEQVSSGDYSSNIMYAIWGYRPVGTGMDDFENNPIDELSTDLRVNPYLNAQNAFRETTNDAIWANVRLNYNFTPKLDLTISGVYNNKSQLAETFSNSKTSGGYPFPSNIRKVNGAITNTYGTSYVNENILKYRTTFNRVHRVELMGGFTMQYNIAKVNGYSTKLIPHEELGMSGLDQGEINSMISRISDNSLVSFLARANYNYKSKYLFTVSFRGDGSSKFSPQNRWGYFPSGSVAWNMSQEDFLKHNPVISNSKIRLSYGVTGNNRVSDFAYMSSMGYSMAHYYSFNNNVPTPGIVVTAFGNDDLKWESTYQLDAGYDLSLFRGKVNFTVDYYRKTTKNLLLNANLPYSSGYDKAFKNVGKIRNEGFEFALNTINVKTNRFQWNTDFNIAFNKNKILALSENQGYIESSVLFPRTLDKQPLYLAEVGGPAAVFYGYKWLGNYQVEDFNIVNGKYELKPEIATNGDTRKNIQPGDIKYLDVNGDGVVNLEDKVKLGTAIPKHFGGLNNTFQYDRFSASVFLQWSYGNKVFNANRMIFEGNFYKIMNLNQYASYENRWTPDNPNNELFRTEGYGPRGMLSSRTLEDGSFLRLKTISVSYDFPEHLINKIKIKGLQVNAAAQNLHTWTKYSGVDPEVSIRNSALTPGFDYTAYPREKSIVLGLKVIL